MDNSDPITLLRSLQHERAILHRISWSNSGQFVAAACADTFVRVWDSASGDLAQCVPSQTPQVTSVAWSPDDTLIAFASADVKLFSMTRQRIVSTLTGHRHSVWSMSWSPDGRVLASGSHDKSVILWDVTSGSIVHELRGHSDEILAVSWSPDGKTLATASSDNTIRMWDRETGVVSNILRRHVGHVTSLAWSPDGRMLASGSRDRTIVLWNASRGWPTHILERHTGPVAAVDYSADGSVLASSSYEGDVIIWRTDTTEPVHGFKTHQTPRNEWKGLRFHPQKPILAILGSSDRSIDLYALNFDRLNSLLATEGHTFYRNAKVILLGDTGVGKSGLGLALLGEPWSATDSTHGRRVWTLSRQVHIRPDAREEIREILLWDLAGQPDYRIIHQLHLSDVAIALVLIDSRNHTDPFSGVTHWAKALKQARKIFADKASYMKTFLVAAREDVGRLGVSNTRMADFLTEMQFDQSFRTSAKEGWGIEELRSAIQSSIPWSQLPTGSTSELFQNIKAFIVKEKELGRILSTRDDLYRSFVGQYPTFAERPNPRNEFDTCISLVESRDLIQALSFGSLVLLQPEMLDSYAAAIIHALKDEPDDVGSIMEVDARLGNFRMAEGERIPSDHRDKEELLRIATIEELLRHEIALRYGGSLVFPSESRRELSSIPNDCRPEVLLRFEGALTNIYATLVVRLSNSDLFRRESIWKAASTFRSKSGGICGMQLVTVEDGTGELSLFFDASASVETKTNFEEYVRTHLERWAIPASTTRRTILKCNTCSEDIPERQVNLRRHRGASTLTCPVCETVLFLPIPHGAARLSSTAFAIQKMDDAADSQREQDVAASILQGKVATHDFDVFLCHNSADKHLVKNVGLKLKGKGVLPWLDEWHLPPGTPFRRELESRIESIRAAAVFVGRNGIGPWQDEEIDAILNEFIRRRRPVIPVLLHDPKARVAGGYIEPKDVPIFLRGRVWVDFRRRKPNPLDQLVWGITGENR